MLMKLNELPILGGGQANLSHYYKANEILCNLFKVARNIVVRICQFSKEDIPTNGT